MLASTSFLQPRAFSSETQTQSQRRDILRDYVVIDARAWSGRGDGWDHRFVLREDIQASGEAS